MSVTNGMLGREVIVRLSTNNGTATGIYVIVINLVGSSYIARGCAYTYACFVVTVVVSVSCYYCTKYEL